MRPAWYWENAGSHLDRCRVCKCQPDRAVAGGAGGCPGGVLAVGRERPLHLVGDDVGDALARADQQDASLRVPVVTSALTRFVPVDPCSDRGGDLQRAVLWGMVAGFTAGDDFQCGDVCLAPFSLLLAD
jgi:hypothetical protein